MATTRKKQWLLIFLCCLAYSFAYASRYSYNANIAPMMDFYGVTRADAGMVSTFFFFAYGVFQLLHAIFCKFYNKKVMVGAALLISAAVNLVLFFQPPFWAIKFLWLLNGICQSALWPLLVLTLSETLEKSMIKRAVFIMSLAVMFGTLIAYGGSALFNLFSFFRGSFLLGAVLTAGIGLVWLLSYSTLTKEKFVSEEPAPKTEQKKALGGIGGAMVGLIATGILFAAVSNLVKDGLNTWTPVILKEQFGFGDSVSIVLTLILPVFGMFGAVLAMQANKRIKDFSALSGFFYLLLSGCLFGLTVSLRAEKAVPTLLLFGLISCLAHGINSILTSIMPFSLREKINSGFLAGLMNASTYIGSTVSAYGLGKLADGNGWDLVMIVLLIAAISATLLAGAVWVVGRISQQTARKTEGHE